jgi:hypothetical protein
MLTIKGMSTHHPHSKIIDSLGGTVAVAEMCRVTSQAVSKWRKDGIPEARLMYLQIAKPEAPWNVEQSLDAA